MSTTAFPVLTDIENAFKTIIWGPMIKAGEVWLDGAQAAVPILDIPFVEGLEDDIIEAITNALFNQIIIFIDVTSIRLINPILQNKWTTAQNL